LGKEASVDQPNNNGSTPLVIAAGEGHAGVVKILLEKGADKSLRDKWGTALEFAQENGHQEIAALLE